MKTAPQHFEHLLVAQHVTGQGRRASAHAMRSLGWSGMDPVAVTLQSRVAAGSHPLPAPTEHRGGWKRGQGGIVQPSRSRKSRLETLHLPQTRLPSTLPKARGSALHVRLFLENLIRALVLFNGLRSRHCQRALLGYHYHKLSDWDYPLQIVRSQYAHTSQSICMRIMAGDVGKGHYCRGDGHGKGERNRVLLHVYQRQR